MQDVIKVLTAAAWAMIDDSGYDILIKATIRAGHMMTNSPHLEPREHHFLTHSINGKAKKKKAAFLAAVTAKLEIRKERDSRGNGKLRLIDVEIWDLRYVEMHPPSSPHHPVSECYHVSMVTSDHLTIELNFAAEQVKPDLMLRRWVSMDSFQQRLDHFCSQFNAFLLTVLHRDSA